MPLQWRLQVLEAGLKDRLNRSVSVIDTELFTLAGAARDSALDALTAGAEMPFVLVRERVVHTGDLDADAIVSAIEGLGAAETDQ